MHTKEIYIVHVDDRTASFAVINDKPEYSFCPQGQFCEWVVELKHKHPEYKLRCVMNKGIEDWLRERKKESVKIDSKKGGFVR